MRDPIPFEFNPDVSKQYHALKLCSEIRPIYASAFLMSWRDFRTNNDVVLGDIPAKDRHHRAVWFVTFGTNHETGELLLHICLPLKIGGTSRGIWPIYLAFTPDCLDGDAADPASCLNICAPPTTPHFEKAGVQAGTKLIRCQFKLKKQSMVIMSLPSSYKPLSDHFRGLLLSLKSLSQAMSFDIYLPHTVQSWDTVLQFFQTLYSGSCRSPEINFKATFDGRNVGKTDWKAYGIDDEDTLAVGWNPIVEQSPPSYDEAIRSSPQRINAVPSAPDEFPDQLNFENLPSATQASPFCSNDEEGNNSEDNCEVRDERGTRQDKEPQAVFSTSIEARAHAQLQKNDQRESNPQPERRLKRKAGQALSDPGPAGRPSTFVNIAGTTRESKGIAAFPDGLVPKLDASQRGMEARAVELLLKDVAISPGSVFDPSSSNRRYFDDRQFCWFCDAVLWLRSAWPRRNSVHESHFSELIAMCNSIKLRKRKAFSEVRGMCMAKYVQEKSDGSDEGPWGVDLKHRASWIGDFINRRLGAGSDTLIIDDLASLHLLANEWRRVSNDKGEPKRGRERESARRRFSFDTQMAACVLLAMYKSLRITYLPDQQTLKGAQGGEHSSGQDNVEPR